MSKSPSITQLTGGRARNFVCEEMGIALRTYLDGRKKLS